LSNSSLAQETIGAAIERQGPG